MKPESHAMAENRPQKTSDNDKTMSTTNDTNDTTVSTESNENRLYAAPTGPNTYTVLSRGNAGRNAYSVDVANLTCTCEDFLYNVAGDDDRNVCKHLEKAISVHPHKEAYYSYKGGQVAAVEATQSAKDKETAEAVEETEAVITETPEDARDRLETSLADTGIAFKFELDGERIWFGFDEYVEDGFGKYISNPEMVEYEPDNAPEGFKNYISAGDVDAYINEVLN